MSDKPIKVLLIEDNSGDAHLVQAMLAKAKGASFDLEHAARLSSGLERLAAGGIDVVLLDLSLLHSRGLESLIEAQAQMLQVPMIVLTGVDDEELAVKAVQKGAQDYLVKGQMDSNLLACAIRCAIERKQIGKVLRRHSRELALLNRLGRELTATLDLQQAAERLMQAVIEIIGAEGASVWLWDEKQEGWLACQAITHSQEHSLADLRLSPGQGIAGWVAQNEESAIVPYAPNDPRFFPGIDAQTGLRTISLLAAPLRIRGKVIGVLEVVNKQNGNFDTDDLALVETLAASAAIAIDNAKLVEALRQHVEELKARSEDLDAFAHSVAHDLKTPLAKIIGFVEVLEEDYATISEEEARLYLNTIMQSGHKMSNIIDELLLLASVRKIEEAELEPLDMAEIVAAAQRRLTYLTRKRQAEIIMPPEGAWPVALGYAPWVEEVWVNYLSNAIRYGGRPPRVELGATVQADGTVRFWVRDNGPGLTPEEQAQLFTPFERLDQVRAKGHGLGLSIVRRIVAKLGGQVGVDSQVGRGSVFYFTLQGG